MTIFKGSIRTNNIGGKKEMENKIYVLLELFYEGDSFLIDDSFVACSQNIKKLEKIIPSDSELYYPKEKIPNDGHYGDSRKRFRIIETNIL